MNRWLLVFAGLAVTGLGLAAEPPKPPPVVPEEEQGEGVSLTIYNQDFVVVKERRLMDLQKGRSVVRFRDVAATILPETVQFAPLRKPGSARVVEQNYEFDLVGADKLLQKYIDHDITLVTRDGAELRGQLLSFDEQQLILRTGNGIDLLPRAGNIKDVQFSALPGGLLTKPTLVWQLDAKDAGKELVKVAYQARQMNWRVDYRARVNQAGDKLDLAGWVTVTNNTGATFTDARLKLLAGDVHLVKPEYDKVSESDAKPAVTTPDTPQPAFTEKAFAEYHLYELGRKATLKNQETKQIELLDITGIPAQRKYVVGTSGNKVAVVLEFKNSDKLHPGLGIPLPKGPMRVFQRDLDGEQEFAGMDEIDHTPKDEVLNVRYGYAFDLASERKEVASQMMQAGGLVELHDIEVRLRNHKTEAVRIDVVEGVEPQTNFVVVKQSHPSKQRNAKTLVFPVEVKPNAEAVVTYTIQYFRNPVPVAP
jgi:hypothetical protein